MDETSRRADAPSVPDEREWARDRTVLLAYDALKSDGDPSPSHALAVELGLSPANVRQIARRTKVKVHDVVRNDERYADIADLPILR